MSDRRSARGACAPRLGVAGARRWRCSAGACASARPPRTTATPTASCCAAVDATDTDARRPSSYGWSGDAAAGDDRRRSRRTATQVDADRRAARPTPASSNDIVFVVDTSGTTDANAMLDQRQRGHRRVGRQPARRARGSASSPPAPRRSASSASRTDVGRLARGRRRAHARRRGRACSTASSGRPATLEPPSARSSPTVVLFTDGVVDSTGRRRERAEGALDDAGAAALRRRPRRTAASTTGSSAAGDGDRRPDGRDRRRAASIPAARRRAPARDRPAVRGHVGVDRRPPAIQDLDGRRRRRRRRTARTSPGRSSSAPPTLQPRPPVEPSAARLLPRLARQVARLRSRPLAGVPAVAYGVVLALRPRRHASTASSSPTPRATSPPPSDDDDDGSSGVAQTAFLQRAVEPHRGASPSARASSTGSRRMLEQADLPLRAGEAMFFYVAVVVLVAVARPRAHCRTCIGAVIVAARRRPDPAGGRQLPGRPARRSSSRPSCPTRSSCSPSTLRAGYSLMQGVEAVSQEVDGADGQGAPPGRHRGPPRPAARGVARRRRRAHGVAPTSPGPSWPSASSARSAATSPSCC